MLRTPAARSHWMPGRSRRWRSPSRPSRIRTRRRSRRCRPAPDRTRRPRPRRDRPRCRGLAVRSRPRLGETRPMAFHPSGDPTGATVELLQTLIRNQCVNDGTPQSGNETRNADVLQSYVEGPGVVIERWEPAPGRASFVARLEGRDASAPSLCLMGHTDVVPVHPHGWSRDPFGAEMIRNADGVQEVWGRGAVDMLNLTASMAVAFKDLAERGIRPQGDLLFFAVADEEAGSAQGVRWVAQHHPDAIRCDYVLTESGGL